jgi:hypothetical protein
MHKLETNVGREVKILCNKPDQQTKFLNTNA